MLVILKALWLFVLYFQDKFVVESDSSKSIAWDASSNVFPRKCKFLLNEIKMSSSNTQVDFKHILRSANRLAHSLDKQGEDHSLPFLRFSI